jgi:5-dehydro-2-deoxygluconokinase
LATLHLQSSIINLQSKKRAVNLQSSIRLTIDDILAAPIDDSYIFQFAGTNLSKDPSRNATLFAAELAQRTGTEVVLDIDFRPDQWYDPRAFGVAIRSALRLVDIVIGTEDEIFLFF